MEQLNARLISDMYDFLSQQTLTILPCDGAFVFGRNDTRVAEAATSLYREGLINWALFTGGFGKDSGFLANIKMPEAVSLAATAYQLGFPSQAILLEERARHGADNCKYGLDVIKSRGITRCNLIVVAHSTSLRRLVWQLQNEIDKRQLGINLQSAGTRYPFDPTNSKDAFEASSEMVRLAEWPKKFSLTAVDDLDNNLVEYAKEVIRILN